MLLVRLSFPPRPRRLVLLVRVVSHQGLLGILLKLALPSKAMFMSFLKTFCGDWEFPKSPLQIEVLVL